MDPDNTAPSGANAQVQQSADNTSTEVKMPSEAFKKRLDETASSERKRVLKEFGFESLEDGKRAIKLFKELQDAQLTEQQRVAKELDELKPRADKAEKRAAKLAEKLNAMVEEQFNALPEAAREAIDELAAGDPEERLKLMAAMRKAGLAGAAPSGNAPTTTAPPANAPKQGAVSSKFDEWQKLDSNPATRVLGGIFYANNRDAIERDRPAPTG